MDPDYNNHDQKNIGVAASHLLRLQNELDVLENKLSRTVLSLQSLLEEDEKRPDAINGAVYEITGQTSTSKQEETLRHRPLAGVHKAAEEYCRMVNSVGANDLNKPEDKTSDNFGENNNTWRTCDYWSLPPWLQDNFYILKGYRPPLPSFQACFRSIFRIHTETINIWTHLLGCLLFIILFLHATLSSLPLQDKLVLSPFFVGAILCLGFSSALHTVQCHSLTVSSRYSHLDYCGITLLIIGSFVPWMYYAFFCDHRLKILYLTGVLSLGICATVVSLSKKFNDPLYHPLRATVFVVFGLSGVVPGVHFIFIDGWKVLFEFASPLLLAAVFYIVGAVVYAVRVPERIFPGKCDILFQSHQFFHVLVVLATLIDYIGIFRVATFAQFGRNDPNFCRQRQIYYTKHFSS